MLFTLSLSALPRVSILPSLQTLSPLFALLCELLSLAFSWILKMGLGNVSQNELCLVTS